MVCPIFEQSSYERLLLSIAIISPCRLIIMDMWT